jgi:hypothetical protein
MDHADRMSRRERVAQHRDEARDDARLPSMALSKPALESAPFDELLRLKQHSVVGHVHVNHSHHSGVVDLRRRSRLTDEAVQRVEMLAGTRLDDLDGDSRAVRTVDAFVDSAHAARAEHLLDLESIAEHDATPERPVGMALRQLRESDG